MERGHLFCNKVRIFLWVLTNSLVLSQTLALFNPVSAADTPKLEVSTSGLDFEDTSSASFTIKNSGDGQLTWTVSSEATWIFSGNQRLVDHPVSSSITKRSLGPGEQIQIDLTSHPAGLPLGEQTANLLISSTAGTKQLPMELVITEPDFRGLWVGYLKDPARPALGLPGLALRFSRANQVTVAHIDAIKAPAFATSLRRNAAGLEFSAAEGSEAVGHVQITDIGREGALGLWTLVALDSQQFQLISGDSPTATLTVGTSYNSPEAGATFIILPSLSGRSYQKGDMFNFEIGHFGIAKGELIQVNSTNFSGAFVVAAELSLTDQEITRAIELNDLEIPLANRLKGTFTIIHEGLLPGAPLQMSGNFELFREP